MAQIKILTQKPILESGSFRLIEYQVEKDSTVHTHTNILMPDIIFVIPVNEQEEVYLVSQYRYLLEAVKLEIVAGVIDGNESPEEAARRELKEETGLTAKKLIKIATLERGASFVSGKYHIFIAREIEAGTQELDDFEDITVIKMPFQEAVKKVTDGEINTVGGVSALLLADRFLQEGKL
jgi:ADP-ribose pyrophosphatase